MGNPNHPKHENVVIAVDIDEVLGDFLGSLIKFHNKYYNTQLKLSDFHSYEFHEVWGGTVEEATEKVQRFFKSEYFVDIPSIPQAFETLQELSSWNIFRFVVVTSRQTILEETTKQWLNKHFPGIFQEVRFGNIYGLSGKKTTKPEMCQQLNAKVLIDDSLKYARECSKQGIRVFLFDLNGSYSWNKLPPHKKEGDPSDPEYKNIVRCFNWNDVKNQLTLFVSDSPTFT